MQTLREIINFDKPVIYLDIEATIFENNHRVLQLAAIVVKNNEIVDEFNMWANPNSPISKHVLALVNKDNNFFLSQRSNIFLLKEFVKFASKYDQFICFGSYDQEIMKYQYSTIKKEPIKLIDIQDKFFNKLLKNNKSSLSLSLLAEALSINNTQKKEHDALLDAKMLFNVVNYSLEIDNIENLKKMIYGELIKPRRKLYRKNSSKENKKTLSLSKDWDYVYFDLKINKKNYDDSSKEKYVSSINFVAKKFSSKGVLLKEFTKNISFAKHEQDILDKNINWIYKKFQDIFFVNSIIIVNKSFSSFVKYYFSMTGSLPSYYYISYENLSSYVSDILKINNNEFINDNDLMNKLISIIRPKWNKAIILNKGVK
ncbi:MAG: exonuclease domain-containing protein [Mycoplasmoidaceae bacterium]